MLRAVLSSLTAQPTPKFAEGSHVVAYRIHDGCVTAYHGVISAVSDKQQGFFGSRFSYRVRVLAESRSPLAPHEASAFASQIVTHGDASLVYYDAAEKSVRGLYNPRVDAAVFAKPSVFRAVLA